MSTFRELVGSVREQWETAMAEVQGQAPRPPARPTSLREAGSTGASDAERARTRQDRAGESASTRDNRYPESQPPNDQDARGRRRPATPPVASRSLPDPGNALRAALRSPASLRTAILVREVLDPPLALRNEDRSEGR
jgi:hypothetical protein